jgi:hypothetical protein
MPEPPIVAPAPDGKSSARSVNVCLPIAQVRRRNP